MSERSDDPFDGRHPTSHERLTGLPWDASYRDGPAPWEIGGPQPAVVRLAAAGGFTGTVLDAGCGTGENALHLLCLRDDGPDTGPHPVSEDELRASFATGWDVVAIEPDRVHTRYHDDGVCRPGWPR